MKLAFKRLEDYPLKSVEEVRVGDKVIGLLERQDMDVYKAFLGSGFSCRYLALYYSRAAAVQAIVRMAYE